MNNTELSKNLNKVADTTNERKTRITVLMQHLLRTDDQGNKSTSIFQSKIGATLVLTALLTSSCSLFPASDDGLKKQLHNDLIAGNAHFYCSDSCQATWQEARPGINRLHNTGQWRELAFEVQKIGYSNDLSWYYLGRAAEGLSAPEAAKSYFKTSIEKTTSGQHCNACNGLTFPQESSQQLSSIASSENNITTAILSYPLYVNVEPANAVIKIMNIKPKFSQGIQLTKGNYYLKILKSGFQTINKTIKISDSPRTITYKMVPIRLKKSVQNNIAADYSKQSSQAPVITDITPIKPTPKISKTATTARVKKDTELKAQPSLFSGIKGKLRRGEKVNILENQGDWVKIKTKQGEGYIYSDLLR